MARKESNLLAWSERPDGSRLILALEGSGYIVARERDGRRTEVHHHRDRHGARHDFDTRAELAR